jgi:hypothetical protein
MLVIMEIKWRAGEVDEIYQDDELSYSFNIDPDSTLNSLLNDANDVTVPEGMKHKIFNVLYISYFVLIILYYVLAILYYVFYIPYYILDEYSLVLVLNRM